MKAHFTTDYDYYKFKGKTKIKAQSFFNRKDRIYFVKLARKLKTKQEVEEYFIANFSVLRDKWIGDFSEDIYLKWKERKDNIVNVLERELTPHVKNFEELFVVKGHPILFREYLGKRISAETMVVLNTLVNYSKDWDAKMGSDRIWKKEKKFLTNYEKSLTINKDACRMCLIKMMEVG